MPRVIKSIVSKVKYLPIESFRCSREVDVNVSPISLRVDRDFLLIRSISMTKDASASRDARQRVVRPTVDEEKPIVGKEEKFLINYRARFYDICDFLKYHPGGRKVFCSFKDRSLDKAFDQNPHSKAAFHLLEDFTVDDQQKSQEYEVSLTRTRSQCALRFFRTSGSFNF